MGMTHLQLDFDTVALVLARLAVIAAAFATQLDFVKQIGVARTRGQLRTWSDWGWFIREHVAYLASGCVMVCFIYLSVLSGGKPANVAMSVVINVSFAVLIWSLTYNNTLQRIADKSALYRKSARYSWELDEGDEVLLKAVRRNPTNLILGLKILNQKHPDLIEEVIEQMGAKPQEATSG